MKAVFPKLAKMWRVYSQYYLLADEPEDSFEDDWVFEGETFAVSEAQAINNVRHRNYGDYGASQYKPVCRSGHWENGLRWKAEEW